MSFEIVLTEHFEREFKYLFKKHASILKDIELLIDSLKKQPVQGESLGKNCYKVRLKITSKGKGKSGGARVIICVVVSDGQIYLLSIYDKSQKSTLSDTELKALLEGIK